MYVITIVCYFKKLMLLIHVMKGTISTFKFLINL